MNMKGHGKRRGVEKRRLMVCARYTLHAALCTLRRMHCFSCLCILHTSWSCFAASGKFEGYDNSKYDETTASQRAIHETHTNEGWICRKKIMAHPFLWRLL